MLLREHESIRDYIFAKRGREREGRRKKKGERRVMKTEQDR
jgi:hypothetical protein